MRKVGTFKAYLIPDYDNAQVFENMTRNEAYDAFVRSLGFEDDTALAASRGQTLQELADWLVLYELEEPAPVEELGDYVVYEIRETRGSTDGEIIE